MIIADPTPEERAKLKAEHAHRFPELRYFPKPGDDGKMVKLPVVLGNPSGACHMPAGARASKAWDAKVAEGFGGEKVGWAQLVVDCVLWPAPHVWAEWCERWPALPDSVRTALITKYGGSEDSITEPGEDVEAPKVIAEAREQHKGATWMRFEPKGLTVDLLVKAPTSTQWALFTEAMRKPGAASWDLVHDLANACTAVASQPVAEAFLRWPGLAVLVVREASYLAGVITKYEEGEL